MGSDREALLMPVACPLASSGPPQAGRTVAASRPITTTNVSSPPRPLRVSRRRLEVIRRELTERDLAILDFVVDWRVATGSQLRRRFFDVELQPETAARSARRTLGRLVDDRVLERLGRRVGGLRAGSESYVYCVGRSGVRLLAQHSPVRRLTAPGDRYVAHTLDVTELAVQMMVRDRGRELDLIEVQPEPACWRRFIGPGAVPVVLKPDLFARIGAGTLEDRWLIEVDRATEAAATIAEKAKTYLAHVRSGAEQRDHGVYPRVLWTVPDDRRAGRVTSVLAGVGRSFPGLFSVCRFDETVERMSAEARR
jgi:Replication-relaxation